MAGSNFKKDMNQNDVIDSARAFFTSFGILFLIFLIALVASLIWPPKHGEQAKEGAGAPPAASANFNPEEFVKGTCTSCHGANLEGSVGPKLANIGSKYSADQIDEILKNGKGGMPAGLIPDEAQRKAVAKWLSEKK